MKTGGLSHPRKLRSRQGYAFSALFPEIRDLSTMKGLLDLKWQGYGFRAANLCFKAHGGDEIKHNLVGNKAYLARARGMRWW
jgi:hypothetical protein